MLDWEQWHGPVDIDSKPLEKTFGVLSFFHQTHHPQFFTASNPFINYKDSHIGSFTLFRNLELIVTFDIDDDDDDDDADDDDDDDRLSLYFVVGSGTVD